MTPVTLAKPKALCTPITLASFPFHSFEPGGSFLPVSLPPLMLSDAADVDCLVEAVLVRVDEHQELESNWRTAVRFHLRPQVHRFGLGHVL
jgi:hypothetical protein